MRRLVKAFDVGPYPVELWETDEPIDETDPDGLCESDVRPRRVTYHTRNVGPERWAIIFHEMLHLAASIASGLEMPPYDEEHLADTLGLVLTSFLGSIVVLPDVASAPGASSEQRIARLVATEIETSQLALARDLRAACLAEMERQLAEKGSV